MEKFSNLEWKIEQREKILHTPVFDIYSQKEVSPEGFSGNYVSIAAPDWVVIVAVHNDNFILVNQFRHGEERVTVEFPGGVCDSNENPEETARRELLEETGFSAGRMTFLGKVSSNPALFKNHFSVYLAEELVQTGEQHLDSDEVLNYLELPRKEVLERMGSYEFSHAYTGTAIAFYLRHLLRTEGKIEF